MAAIGLPAAALVPAVVVLSVLRHRRPFVLDRRADRLLDGRSEVCALSEIRGVEVAERGFDPTEYAVALALADGRTLAPLAGRVDDFRHRADAERLASEVAGFLGVAPPGPPSPDARTGGGPAGRAVGQFEGDG